MKTTIVRSLLLLALPLAFATESPAQSAQTAACPGRPGNGVRQAPARPAPNRPLVGQRATLPVNRLSHPAAGAPSTPACGAASARSSGGNCGANAPSQPQATVLAPGTISDANIASANAALGNQGYALRKQANGSVVLVRVDGRGR